MARTPGSNKIDIWLRSKTKEEKAEFKRSCRKHYHSKIAIWDFLIRSGCDVKSPATVYTWMSKNVLGGDVAKEINADTDQYVGVEVIPLMEKALAQLMKVGDRFIAVIEDEEEIPLNEAITLAPGYFREIRGMAQSLSRQKNNVEAEGLLLMGGARLAEIILGMGGIKDSAHETLFQKTLEAALLQLKEEVISKEAPLS